MKKFNKTTSIHPCRLNKNDLFELEALIKEGFPIQKRPEDYTVSSNLKNFAIYENSLEDFLNHKNLPDSFSRISFRLIGWSSDNQIDKGVDLTFYDSYISLDVSGFSESWVNGKNIQLLDYLKTKRPFMWFLSCPPAQAFRGASSIIILWSVVLIVYRIYYFKLNSLIFLLSLLILLSVLNFLIGKFNYVEIFLKEKESWWKRLEPLFVVFTFLASVATIIGFIYQMFVNKK
jgi:hypothetical protein